MLTEDEKAAVLKLKKELEAQEQTEEIKYRIEVLNQFLK